MLKSWIFGRTLSSPFACSTSFKAIATSKSMDNTIVRGPADRKHEVPNVFTPPHPKAHHSTHSKHQRDISNIKKREGPMGTTPGRLAGTAEPFLLWHFFLLASLSDAASFSWSGSLLTSLNFDNPSCWQLRSRKPDTPSPDKLLSLLSLLPYSLDSTFLFPSSLSTLPYSLHFPSLWKPLVFSLLYSFRFSILFTLHFPILCTSRLFLLFTSLLSSFPFSV